MKLPCSRLSDSGDKQTRPTLSLEQAKKKSININVHRIASFYFSKNIYINIYLLSNILGNLELD